MSTYKTRPIGEIFKYGKIKLQVVENEHCADCYFCGRRYCICFREDTGYCGEYSREDQKNVIFKRIHK